MNVDHPDDHMHESALNYGELLHMLRRDLQLDAATDILPGTLAAALVDRNGKAPFAQLLPTNSQVKIASGVATMTWPGGTGASNTTAIGPVAGAPGHGANFFATGISTTVAFYVVVTAPNVNGSANLQAYSTLGSPPAATTQQAYWLALLS